MNINTLLSRLEMVRGKHPKWMTRCPSHEDKSPSLSIKSMDDGRILIHCHAGCGAADIMSAIGLSLSDLFPSGKLGEFMSKPYRQSENRLENAAYFHLLEAIQRERAKP